MTIKKKIMLNFLALAGVLVGGTALLDSVDLNNNFPTQSSSGAKDKIETTTIVDTSFSSLPSSTYTPH